MPPIKTVPSLTQISINCVSKFFEENVWQANTKFKLINHSNSKWNTMKENSPKDDQKEENIFDVNSTKFNLNIKDCEIEQNGIAVTQNQVEILKTFLIHLAQDVTSHAHCHLQEVSFWSILTPLNRLYNKPISAEGKTLIRDIVPWFVNSSLRVLDFGSFKMFTEATMFKAIYGRIKSATNLEKLVFGRSCYWRSKMIQRLSEVLLSISNLQILHIKYICIPEMLQGLPESCPHLRELSLEGSKLITDEEVSILAQFVNIETLDISGTSITGKGCKSLVLGLPHLTWLTHCPFNCNSDVLIFESRAALFRHIRSQSVRKGRVEKDTDYDECYGEEPARIVNEDEAKENVSNKDNICNSGCSNNAEKHPAPLKLKLKSFWLFNSTTEELLLTHLCPDLERLRLDFIMQDLSEVPEMEAIRQLSHLKSLALYTYDSCPAQLVTNVIQSTTDWLTTLHLHLGDEWFFVAPIINTISQFCRNLTFLVMEGDYKGQHPLEDADQRLDFSLPPGGLGHLKEVRLAGCVSDARIMHLLIQAPNLRVLHMDGELEWLHDETFTSAIRQNLLLQLKILWFNVSSGVTLSSVRRLLQSENNLQRVGRLCLMSCASKDTYQELLRLVKRLNLATELIWVTDQREIREIPEAKTG